MKELRENLLKRFLKYVTFETTSQDDASSVPTSNGQMVFARYLEQELKDIGLEDVILDEKGYLYATLPATTNKELPVVGFISHLDTSPDMSGKDVKPRVVSNYDGKDIVLDKEANIVLSTKEFPEVMAYKGDDLVVTDGHTLLGADDKAGIAEIVSAVEYLLKHPEIEHGKVRIAFNPDEEIGRGAHHFNVPLFGCNWAYTVDGSAEGELEFENFNAGSALFTIQGRNVHPGYAKGKMINALRVANAIVDIIPMQESPEETEGYEGFYHLMSINGGVDSASVSYIIRDHDRAKFEKRLEFMYDVAVTMNKFYGSGTVSVDVKEQYRNMREKVEPCMHIIELAKSAMEQAGVVPQVKPIRGGTDGAQLSFMGLPCPNLFAGGINFHSRYEFVSLQVMEKATNTVVKIIEGVKNLNL
ncbi:MAG: peptidase T [Bacteroidaceae bacterium]|nr:peptidase T [Bacteroidaceae bacterium]